MAKETVTVRVGRFLKENPGKQFSATEIAEHLGVDREKELLVAQVVLAMRMLQSDGVKVIRSSEKSPNGEEQTYASFH